METAVFLLLIVGCSDDLRSCKELPAPTPMYANAQECEGALPPEMRRHAQQFPQVLAKCIKFDPALEEESAELTWYINSQGDLIASVERASESHVAAGQADRHG